MVLGKKETSEEFVSKFSDFYRTLFNGMADSINKLADVQKHHKKEYVAIKEFGKDPASIEEVMEKLPSDKQATLLKLLLKAGRYGQDFVNIFESTEEQKRKLATDLKKFAEELTNEMKNEGKKHD